MAVQSWIHRNVVLPIAQNCAAGILGAGALLLGQGTITVTGGCTSAITAEVAKGEQVLALGDLVKARAIASDVVAESPNCDCSNTYYAAVAEARMKLADAQHDETGKEASRRECFSYALKARPLFGERPRVTALLETCRATS